AGELGLCRAVAALLLPDQTGRSQLARSHRRHKKTRRRCALAGASAGGRMLQHFIHYDTKALPVNERLTATKRTGDLTGGSIRAAPIFMCHSRNGPPSLPPGRREFFSSGL